MPKRNNEMAVSAMTQTCTSIASDHTAHTGDSYNHYSIMTLMNPARQSRVLFERLKLELPGMSGNEIGDEHSGIICIQG